MTLAGKTLSIMVALASWPTSALAARLIFDEVFVGARVFVYELPDPEGRPEALKYVEAMRDLFKPGAQVLDASAGESVLKSKLANGFVLYTTLGDKSKLLDLATRGMATPFRWRDLAAPADGLRLFLVGKNPYGSGHCAIFAAGSNRALVDTNSEPHGGRSYAALSNGDAIAEGDYDENLIPLTERLARKEALEDVNQFFTTLERVHPNLLARADEEGYRKLKEKTAAAISDEISIEDLASDLYYAGAWFRDGHTSVTWHRPPSEANAQGRRFPAFRLRFDNGRFLIADAKDPSIVDLELVSVNGMPTPEFLRPILDRCSGELPGFRAARFLDDEAFWYSLTNLFGGAAHYTLGLRDAEGHSHEAMLQTLPYKEYRQGRGMSYRPNREGTGVEFFDSGATAHFFYSSFRDTPEARKEVDRAFEQVRARGSRNLVIDMRGNWGGDVGMGDYLFGYLYSGKFRATSEVRVKASRDMMADCPAWAKPVVAVMRGHVITHGIKEHMERKPAGFFGGRVYLLVDNGSFSMATEFAAMVRDYGAGTIIGYETGGTPITFAAPIYLTLKNSNIKFGVPWMQAFPSKPRPGDDEHGIVPDVPLDEAKLADFRGERDPVLAYAVRYAGRAAK